MLPVRNHRNMSITGKEHRKVTRPYHQRNRWCGHGTAEQWHILFGVIIGWGLQLSPLIPIDQFTAFDAVL